MVETALALLSIGGVLAGVILSELRKRVREWRSAVESCGLEVLDVSPAWSPRLTARDGLGEVRIEASGQKDHTTRITLEASGPPDFHKVTIRPQPEHSGHVPEIRIRDLVFDGELILQGPELLVTALLDEETRRLLSRVNTCGLMQLSSGELRVDLSHTEVGRVLPLLLDLRRRLAAPLDIPRRLAENARQDPVPGVRLHNLLLLVRELPEHPETAEAFRAARWDPSPELRLWVARQMGAEGRVLLRELAEGLEDDDVSAEAVWTLDRALPFEFRKDILDRALARRRLRTARACLRTIGRGRDAEAVEVLARVMEEEYGELAPVAAEALGTTGSPAAEPPLIQALQRDETELRVAAAKALAGIGSVAAVLPLKEAAERSRLDLELRRAARQAIAEIQSRVQGASPGQLSLAGANAGQLSLAEAEAGRLSLAAGAQPGPGSEEAKA